MKMRWKIALFSIIGVIGIGTIMVALAVKNIGVANLKLMYTLNTTDQSIISMEETSDGNGHYLTKVKTPAEIIRERMEKEGWIYIQQEGSGYFFEKDNQRIVVTTKVWNSNYVKITVQNNVVNLADDRI